MINMVIFMYTCTLLDVLTFQVSSTVLDSPVYQNYAYNPANINQNVLMDSHTSRSISKSTWFSSSVPSSPFTSEWQNLSSPLSDGEYIMLEKTGHRQSNCNEIFTFQVLQVGVT